MAELRGCWRRELPEGLPTRKSSRSGPNGGQSVELVPLPELGAVGVYSTLVPKEEAWTLFFSKAAWRAFFRECNDDLFTELDTAPLVIVDEIVVRSLAEEDIQKAQVDGRGNFRGGFSIAMANNPGVEVWFDAAELREFLYAVEHDEFADMVADTTDALAAA